MPKRPRLQRYVLLTAALCLSSFSQARFLLNTQDIAPQSAGFLHGTFFLISPLEGECLYYVVFSLKLVS
ncbi:unnamed protein product [Malus baccata var. baccata]